MKLSILKSWDSKFENSKILETLVSFFIKQHHVNNIIAVLCPPAIPYCALFITIFRAKCAPCEYYEYYSA